MHEIATRLAVRLKALREASGLTQEKLAKRAGLRSESVARLERVVRGRASANQNPSLETLARIAAALGVDVVELLRPGTGAAVVPREEDRFVATLGALVSGATPELREQILRVAEVLVRESSTAGKSRRASPSKTGARRPARRG